MRYDPIHNKYYKIYNNIIYLAKLRNWSKDDTDQYCEIHHIIPKSLGGSNTQDNLVLLTAREHFIVHKLLTKFLTGKSKYKMIYAYQMMFCSPSYISRFYNSTEHEKAKTLLKTCIGEKHHLKNKSQTQEHRLKNSIANSGSKNHFYGKKHTLETCEKLRLISTGKKQSQNTIEKKILKISNHYFIKDITNNIDYGVVHNLKQWCQDKSLNYSCMRDILNQRQSFHKSIKWQILSIQS